MPGKKDIVPVTNLRCQNGTTSWGGDRRAPRKKIGFDQKTVSIIVGYHPTTKKKKHK